MLIGDLARATNTRIETIRFYERRGLVPVPPRTLGNYRSYGADHLKRLSFIRRARELGLSLDDVRDLIGLAGDAERSCVAVSEMVSAHVDAIDRKIADLGALRRELAPLIGDCHGSTGKCRILEALAPRNSA